MPSCLRPSAMASGSVRTRNSPHFAMWAVRDPDLLAVRARSRRRRRRRVVRRLARSQPASGSLKPWHQWSIGVEDVRDPPVLLLVGAPADDHRADLPEAVGVVDAGRAVAGHLLGVDDVLGDRRVAAAPLARPVDGGPPALVEPALPGPAPLHLRHDPAACPAAARRRSSSATTRRGTSAGARRASRELVAERLVLVGVGEVHGRPARQADTGDVGVRSCPARRSDTGVR